MGGVVIIGGGHVGRTLLADLVATRCVDNDEVKLLLYRANEGDIINHVEKCSYTVIFEEVLSKSKTEVKISPNMVCAFHSDQANRILSVSSVIVVAVPDIPSIRLKVFNRLLDINDLRGKTIILVKAGQASQPILANMIRRKSPIGEANFVLAESFYGTRVSGNRILGKRKLAINISTWSRDNFQTLSTLRALFPLGEQINRPSWPDFEVKRGIDIMFSATAYFLHVGVALWPKNLNLTKEGLRYNHFVEGIDRTLASQLDAIDRERVRLGQAYGVDVERFPQTLNRQYGLDIRSDFYDMMQSCRGIYTSMSPGSVSELLRSRHILEDVPALHTILWLAERAGVEMRATKDLAQTAYDTLSDLDMDLGTLEVHRPLLASIKGGAKEIALLLDEPQFSCDTAEPMT